MKLKPVADHTITLKSPRELKIMREAGRIVARTVREVIAAMRPGMTTRELDMVAAKSFRRQGAKSTALGYFGFPGHICISVNSQVVHGIPGPLKINAGDLVKLDVAASYNGYVGDTTMTAVVGCKPNRAQERLMRVTQEALVAGIAQARPGNRLSDIGHAIQSHVEKHGLSVVRVFVGHGVGRSMHEAPQVAHFGPPGKGPILKPGMVIAIEPQVNMGSPDIQMLEDGWTAVTADGSLSAHFEHTVAVTDDGPWILTEL
ncbi:MAG TPA: type I methionyl aminopeptidase [Chloroflexota bacterium]|nr:type I methionyl aminopeptidase [Chloroflexota bacterium]